MEGGEFQGLSAGLLSEHIMWLGKAMAIAKV
jgi:hypothetical protein